MRANKARRRFEAHESRLAREAAAKARELSEQIEELTDDGAIESVMARVNERDKQER